MKYAPYSHSKIQRGHCPFSFKRRYIDKAKGIPGEQLLFGQVVHRIIADILNALVKHHEVFYPEIIKEHTPVRLINRVEEIQHLIDIFREKFDVNYDNVVGIEEKVAIDLRGYGTDWDAAYIRGILDIVEIEGKHATITDHKTQYNILSDDDMRNNPQLTFYALLTKMFYPQVETFTVRIYFARYGFTKASERTLEDIHRYWNTLQIQIGTIENIDEWIPIPGQTCSICEYMHECPLAAYDSSGLEVPAVMNEAEAIKQAKLLRVREEQVKQAKSLLAHYASIHGPIHVSDKWSYGYVPRQSVEWPVEATKETFRRHDHSIDPHISFDKPSMKKLVARSKRLDPDFADELESICHHKSSTTFKGYKNED